MSCLAAIGAGLFLSKKAKAYEERKLILLARAWGYYRNDMLEKRWISKEYLVEKHYNIELENESFGREYKRIEVKPNLMIFIDTKTGEKYMYRANSYKGTFACPIKRYFP
jgi:hypothetical protein